MSRMNRDFRRNASEMAKFDASQDESYRFVWECLYAHFGAEIANANYAAVTWIVGNDLTEQVVLQVFEGWQAIERGRRFIPYDRQRVKLLVDGDLNVDTLHSPIV